MAAFRVSIIRSDRMIAGFLSLFPSRSLSPQLQPVHRLSPGDSLANVRVAVKGFFLSVS